MKRLLVLAEQFFEEFDDLLDQVFEALSPCHLQALRKELEYVIGCVRVERAVLVVHLGRHLPLMVQDIRNRGDYFRGDLGSVGVTQRQVPVAHFVVLDPELL